MLAPPTTLGEWSGEGLWLVVAAGEVVTARAAREGTGSLTRLPVFPSPGGFASASDATTRTSYRPSATVRVSQS